MHWYKVTWADDSYSYYQASSINVVLSHIQYEEGIGINCILGINTLKRIPKDREQDAEYLGR